MKILICDSIAKDAIEKLKAQGHEVDDKSGLTKEELLQIVPAYNVLVIRSATKVTADVISAGKNLKVVIRGGVGMDNIDAAAAKAAGIKVMNTPAASSSTVAELALGLMFMLARDLYTACASMKEGKWDKKKFKGSELSGKVLGILGMGRIGTELAKKASALGMMVVGYDPFVKSVEGVNVKIVSTVEELIKNADYISLHMPKTPETANLLGEARFAMMKPTAAIVNCARGGIIDEKALYNALKEGKIRAAAFDVYSEEPPTDRQLFTLPNFIGTPHIGASTDEAQKRIGAEIVKIMSEMAK